MPAFAVVRACAVCAITFSQMVGEEPKCPLCDAMDRHNRLSSMYSSALSKMEMLEQELALLRTQVDLMAAMRGAEEAMDEDDRQFLSDLLTDYRDARSDIGVRVTFGPPTDQRGNPSANGYLVVRRSQRDPMAYLCSSVGGRAIAGYLDEAMRIVGPPQAMAVLSKALFKLIKE